MAKRTRYVGRRGRRRKRGFRNWSLGRKLGVIFGCVLLAFLAAGIGIVASKISKIETVEINTEDLSITNEIEHETGYLNVALFGLDSREGTLGIGNRSDTMMIASLNLETKEVKLVSIYRDTLLQMSDLSCNKANAAYAFGGPEAAMAMINKNMDMNIEKYVSVNFNVLADVIDAVGGLDITMTADEIVHMNNYCVETSEVTGKEYTEIESELGGTYHLNGVQAVSYSRIRYTAGGDMERASRQRLVLSKIAEKAQAMNLSTVNKIIDSAFPNISTNFTLSEMIAYAKDFKEYKLGESIGFPSQHTSDMLTGIGSVGIAQTLTSNVKEVHFFLFGNDGYEVSSTVQAIDGEIAYHAAQEYVAPDYSEDEDYSDDEDYYNDDGGEDYYDDGGEDYYDDGGEEYYDDGGEEYYSE